MSIPGSATPLFLASTAAGPGPAAYSIERSLRFNSADSAYLNRTPSSAGNRKTWTWSGWVKRTDEGSFEPLFSAGNNPWVHIAFRNGKFDCILDAGVGNLGAFTDAIYRDQSAWYHLVLAVDTTQSTAADRIKFYVNGVEVDKTADSGGYPSQNYDTLVNSTITHRVGADGRTTSSIRHGDCYLADVHFIDGQALAPTDFGEPDDNGVWQPIAYTGTYGTNGFHLDFSDSSSNAALGDDSSGNNNDWTVNNITAEAPGLATAKQGMDVVTYSGTSATNAISSLQFQPDFVWIKSRTSTNGHNLYDSVRGANKYLSSHLTAAEGTATNELMSFDSNGFTLGSAAGVNSSSNNYVAWCWRAGGTASSNTDGSITSQVSANTTYGFSIVSYTGNGSTSATTIGHGLNAQPGMIIVKNRDAALNWVVLHQSFTDRIGKLNLTDAFDTGYVSYGDGAFDPAGSTSTVFATYPGTSTNNFGNALNNKYIAYCWSEVAGFSKFGSYTGTGAVGHKITTGFKPAYILFKRTDSLSNWRIVDEKRGTSSLNAETAEAEQTLNFAINADGFTINETGNNPNASGGTYIYAAFAGTPAGEETDSLFDSPQNGIQTDTGAGGEVSGNYATLNPLNVAQSHTFSNGNLEVTTSSSNQSPIVATIGMTSGKYYCEVLVTALSASILVGIFPLATTVPADGTIGGVTNSYGYYASTGQKYSNSTLSSYGAVYDVGDIIGIAFDADNGTLRFYKNGSDQGQAFSGIDASLNYAFATSKDTNAATTCSSTWNFGQRAFAYTAPSGYKALNTANLDDPTIADGSTAMDVALYSGNGSTQTISGINHSPDFVWIKRRNGANTHALFDVIRGVTKVLESSNTGVEKTNDPPITSFDSNGFTVNGTYAQTNASGGTYVGWAWDGGHPATATTGAVSFDGTGDYLSMLDSSDFAFGTGDFTAECFIYPQANASYRVIIDCRDATTQATGWVLGVDANDNVYIYNDGFLLQSGSGAVPENRWVHVAYVRNSGTHALYVDGQSVATSSSSYNYTVDNCVIGASYAKNAEYWNGSISNVRFVKGTALYTSNFTPPTAELTNVTNTKLLCCQSTTSATTAAVAPGAITANGDASATTFNPLDAFSVNGTGYATTSAAGITEGTIPLTGASVNRSAGFSIVSYTGTGAAATVGHGLNVAPKIIIFKNRDAATNWRVYTTMVDGSMDSLFLNTTAAKTDSSLSAFTSSVFYCGTNPDHNGSGQAMIAYCFAPVEGYSAFGSYTGNGSTDGPFVYTGFRPRWLMFKRTDTANSWMIYDAARNTFNVIDNLLKADSADAETSVLGSDLLDFLSNGFKIREDNPGMNASGGTYIYACFSENPFKYARAR